jgi:hypothetical protein
MRINLAEHLLLIAHDDTGSRIGDRHTLDLGLGGAVLAELAIAGRVAVAGRRVEVVDWSPTGDPVLDGALARIAAERRPRKPADQVRRLSEGLRGTLLQRLVDRGVLCRQEDRVLWIFPRTRYPSTTGAEPVAKTDARDRLRLAIDAPGPVEPRTAALCGLVKAVRLEAAVFPGRPRRAVRRRLAAIEKSDWASAAVRRAVIGKDPAIAAAEIGVIAVISS